MINTVIKTEQRKTIMNRIDKFVLDVVMIICTVIIRAMLENMFVTNARRKVTMKSIVCHVM